MGSSHVVTTVADSYRERIDYAERVAWIADAPLFIDDIQVAHLYDAIVQPKFEHMQFEVSESQGRSVEAKAEISAALKAKLGALVQFLLPLKAEGEVGGKVGAQLKKDSRQDISATIRQIVTPERRLEELTRHYWDDFRDRMFFWPSKDSSDSNWVDDAKYSLAQPRAIGFLDLEPGVQLIPTAAEFSDGKIELLYKNLGKKLGQKFKILPPDYPDHDIDNREKKLREYWEYYSKKYDPKAAMLVVEYASAAHQSIRWIDFRIPLGGKTVHLHICPEGKYPAGAFGYNFVNRGYQFGIRMVCTLKSGPDLNVLAIYDR